jgi:hypothetical protein
MGDKINEQDQTLVKINETLETLSRSEDEKVAEQLRSTGDRSLSSLETEVTPEEVEKAEELKKNIPDKIVEKTQGDPNDPLWQGFGRFMVGK